MPPAPLYAGAFSTPPAKVESNAGRYRFLDADNKQCWTDKAQRVFLYRIQDVRAVLNAHRYNLNEETMEVTPK